jgi:hypothetical protein
MVEDAGAHEKCVATSLPDKDAGRACCNFSIPIQGAGGPQYCALSHSATEDASLVLWVYRSPQLCSSCDIDQLGFP